MQIIWLSGSTSQFRKFNISKATLIKATGLFSLLLIVLGCVIYFLGFRIAIQINPGIARAMGGVVTAEQLFTVETGYREKLETVQAQLRGMNSYIDNLNKVKEDLASLATPLKLRNKKDQDRAGKGGVYVPYIPVVPQSDNLEIDIDQTSEAIDALKTKAALINEKWQKQYARLSLLPTKVPLVDQFDLSSNFGVRLDPILGTPAFHAAIDFNAESGTKILAAGSGIVIKARMEQVAGNVIEIQHSEGFVSVYGHCKKLFVKKGDVVARGQVIAEVGNTGRSTGPHLHFGIHQNDRAINPMNVLAIQKSVETQETKF